MDAKRSEEVMRELADILLALDETFNRSHDLRVVCNERCRIRVAVSLDDGSNWDLKMVEKVLLAIAAWERELTAMDTMAGVLQYAYLSRFLEYRGIRDLDKERKNIWRGLPEKTRAKWDMEKAEWQYDIDLEERTALEDTAVDLWKYVDSIVREGEEAVAELARSMEKFETEHGRRLAVSFPLVHGLGAERPLTSHSSAVSSNQPFHVEETKPEVEAIVFQSHRSTLNPKELIAYIDMLTSLLYTTARTSYLILRPRIEEFRSAAIALKDTPRASALKLFTLLHVSGDTRKYYSDYLPDGKVWGNASPESEHQTAIRRATKVFERIIKAIEEERRREREYVPTFIERYELASGFKKTRKTKLLKLLEEDNRKTNRTEGYDGGKLKKLQNVALGEEGEAWAKLRPGREGEKEDTEEMSDRNTRQPHVTDVEEDDDEEVDELKTPKPGKVKSLAQNFRPRRVGANLPKEYEKV
ncbi:hypothetical protein BDV96DRAFT_562691 [Lophiotrema nucula]|uniref:Uncharacterized protein n=1 Tax=Lophiotrema nucula TaxID=690887 RepID=A0A6A5ZUD8_9PLEO|nr:hypothetical protein BDV96DRAFT_562691 [Lophiotrema nucula]